MNKPKGTQRKKYWANPRPMTPRRQEFEERNLRAAIRRWHSYGGTYDKIRDIADVLYATRAGYTDR
jgi:hypothetical protein